MHEMTIRLQVDSDKHLYEQIYEYIRNEINEGKLLPGERLPSTRSLADYLQLARGTVDMAYEQLLSEGYIEAQPYRGFFVCDIETMQGAGDKPGVERNSNTVVVGDGTEERSSVLVDFSPNAIDMSLFPFHVWKRMSNNVLQMSNSDLFSSGEPQGDKGLRTTIAGYLHRSRGVNCTPDQIIVGAGNDYLLMLLEKILGERRVVAMENPTYIKAFRTFSSFGYDFEIVGQDSNGMMAEELRTSAADLAYVMPSHQYPTGTVMPIGRRMDLLKWANAGEGRFLIEDDYDSEFRFSGKPIPSLQSNDKYGKVIYIGTFSKAIAPAIRVSYMVLPESLLDKYRENCLFFSCTVSRIDQRVLNSFISEGHFERHLNRMRKLYRQKHDVLMDNLKNFEGAFEISGVDAGLHILMTDLRGRSENELLEKAATKGVKVYGLSRCMQEGTKIPPKPATVMLGFGGLDSKQIIEGLELLREAWR